LEHTPGIALPALLGMTRQTLSTLDVHCEVMAMIDLLIDVSAVGICLAWLVLIGFIVKEIVSDGCYGSGR
jgi:hypothetical protein